MEGEEKKKRNLRHGMPRRYRTSTEIDKADREERRKRKAAMAPERKERDEKRFMKLEDFLPVETIGQGSFGVVTTVKRKSTGKMYAIKTIRKSQMVRKDGGDGTCESSVA